MCVCACWVCVHVGCDRCEVNSVPLLVRVRVLHLLIYIISVIIVPCPYVNHQLIVAEKLTQLGFIIC